jgi:hypothetical protein
VSSDYNCAEYSLTDNLCLTVCSMNCGRVKVSVNECTAQLADSTEFVKLGSA